MPHLRSWQIIHPSKWSVPQAEAYVQDTTAALTVGMHPLTLAMGPLVACNVLCSVIFLIARANPVWVDEMLDSLAQVSENMAGIMPKGSVN